MGVTEGQLSLFDLVQTEKPKIKNRLSIGDRIGRVVLGEVEIGTIQKVEGNDTYFFYRTDKGTFDASGRADFAQMQLEAEENRKKYKTIEIDHFEKFFAMEYPPSKETGYKTTAMVGIFNGMLFWKEEMTYQFLKEVKDLEKAYQEKVHKITHHWYGEQEKRPYTELKKSLPTKRLYYSNIRKCYSEANFVLFNP